MTTPPPTSPDQPGSGNGAAPNNAPAEPLALARWVGERMMLHDAASRGLGIELLLIEPGHARMLMTVREDMLNGFKTCHGGFITTLADSAFAFACNSTNQRNVAQGIATDFMRAAKLGDVLTADCVLVHSSKSTGVYDVTVTNQLDQLVAVMRGKSFHIQGHTTV